MRTLGAAFLFLAMLAPAARTAEVSYRLRPEVHAGSVTALDVEIGLRADASGRTVIDLPDAGSGHYSRWRFISDLTADGAAMREDGPARRILTSPPNAQITLRYRVRSAYEGEPKGEDGNPYQGAIVLPTWFMSLGDFVFLSPEGRDQAPASFQWGLAPDGWTLASDLDQVPVGAPLTVSDIVNSTLMGGLDLKLLRRPIDGGELRVAIRGAWAFPEERLTDDIATVIDAQRRFWGKESGPYFVNVVPLATSPTRTSIGGTGRFRGFALYGTSNASEAAMRRILAHEHTHNWIPLEQGRMPEGEQEAAAYWYSEGLTDFYTDRTLLRSGVWTPADFVKHLNEVLEAYDTSPVRTAPNSRIVSDFWAGEQVRQLPYQRGYLLAFVWDRKMRIETRDRSDLDQVMFAMRARYAATPAAAKPELVANFERTALEVAGLDVRPDVERFAVRGEAISLPADLFAGCASVSTVTRPVFDLGFDPAATRAKGVFTTVDPEGPAYRAGVREGMKRLSVSGGDPKDSRAEVSSRVLYPNGTEGVIRFRPEGKRSISFQEVELSGGAMADPASCITTMSGNRK